MIVRIKAAAAKTRPSSDCITRAAVSHEAPHSGKCPCGSRKEYKASLPVCMDVIMQAKRLRLSQDCCEPYHRGEWARTAVEAALARLSARLMGLSEFTADSTHPENIAMIGGRRQLVRTAGKLSKHMQRRRMRPIGVCHGPGSLLASSSVSAEDSWLVAHALEFDRDEDGEKGRMFELDRYVKHEGKWLCFCREYQVPGGPFEEFFSRFDEAETAGGLGAEDGDGWMDEEVFREAWRQRAGRRLDGSEWSYGFELVRPAYAPSGSWAEDELLGPFLWDGLAEEDGELAMLQPGQRPRPRRREVVYLDDYAPPKKASSSNAAAGGLGFGHGPQLQQGGGDGADGQLSVRGTVMLNHEFRKRLSALRNPELDLDKWMFRTGRYRGNS